MSDKKQPAETPDREEMLAKEREAWLKRRKERMRIAAERAKRAGQVELAEMKKPKSSRM